MADVKTQPGTQGANRPVIQPIRRLLVANRGEIARRVMRTAHRMGIGTVAIYADGDAASPFVREADTAIALNGRTSAQTYLDISKVIGACRRSGADAVHPGYGFLSENADFAQAVIDAGLIWVGPSPAHARGPRAHRRCRCVSRGQGHRLSGADQGGRRWRRARHAHRRVTGGS